MFCMALWTAGSRYLAAARQRAGMTSQLTMTSADLPNQVLVMLPLGVEHFDEACKRICSVHVAFTQTHPDGVLANDTWFLLEYAHLLLLLDQQSADSVGGLA